MTEGASITDPAKERTYWERNNAGKRPVCKVIPMPRQSKVAKKSEETSVPVVPQQRRCFRPNSTLLVYLHSKYPSENLLTKPWVFLNDILSLVKRTIKREGLFDMGNPSVVLCDPPLEAALGMRALHMTEIREAVSKQLVPEHSEEVGRPWPAPGRPPVKPKLRTMPAPTGRPLGIQERTFLVPINRSVNINDRFRLQSALLSVFRTLPDVPSSQVYFSYGEVSKLLSRYILRHKEDFFDSRNVKMVVCDGDALGEAFGVRAFHRTQVMMLLRSQLIPLTPQEEQESQEDEGVDLRMREAVSSSSSGVSMSSTASSVDSMMDVDEYGDSGIGGNSGSANHDGRNILIARRRFLNSSGQE